MGGVSRDVTALLRRTSANLHAHGRGSEKDGGESEEAYMVRVDGEVQSHQINKVLVSTKAELVGQVEAVVFVSLDGRNLSVLVDVAVDLGSDGGELGNQVHRVLKGVAPVVLLVEALGVRLCERRLVLKCGDGERELGHGVQRVGGSVDELLDKLGHLGARSPLGRERAHLLLGGDFARQEKPEEALGEGLLASGGAGENCLAFGDLRRKGLAAANGM